MRFGPIRRWLIAKPGILALGIAAGVERNPVACIGERRRSAKTVGDRGHPDRAADGGERGDVGSREQCLDLLDRTVCEHRIGPRLDPVEQHVAVGQQDRGDQVDVGADPADALILPGSERATRRPDDLERARDAAGVGSGEPRGGFWILLRQRGMRVGNGERADLGADRGIDRWYRGDPVDQRTHIEAGAADEDRELARGMDLGDRRFGVIGPARRGIADIGAIDMAEQAVGDARLVGGRRARGEDAQVGIDLARIGVDDDAVVALGELDRGGGLAARGRPCDERERWAIADHCITAARRRGVRRFGRVGTNGIPMMFIATLIAATLAKGDVSAACDRLSAAGCAAVGWEWIDDGVAADIAFAADPVVARSTLEGAIAGADVVVQPSHGRQKALLIADMDSTMITVECIDELADYAGIKDQVAAVTEAAMRGELDFEGALDARVALLEGLDEGVIAQCLAERVTIMPGAKALVRTMRAHGGHAVLVSGGFTRFAEPVAAEIGFDRAVANRLLIGGGKLTGKVAKPIVGADAKLATLRTVSEARGLALAETLAVGDGANDLKMIEAAGLGVAYHAKPIVAAAAGARVDHGDLTVLLYAQGYSRQDWTT